MITTGLRVLSYSAIIVASLFISGCNRYQMTFNDAVLYHPPVLFTDFRVADNNLQTCLDQAIKDQSVTEPDELIQLTCTHAGIRDLSGIELFSKLQAINLSHNHLHNITALDVMEHLKILLLNNNNIQSVSELLTLTKLEHVNLSHNSELVCDDIHLLLERGHNKLFKPEQC